VGHDPYELRIAELDDRGKKWKLVSACLPAGDLAASVTIMPMPARAKEDGWLRLLINSTGNRSVAWTLKFAKEDLWGARVDPPASTSGN